MNGAQSLVQTLVGCGVDVCFMNPGTSEMHFVAALDAVPAMRGVLSLFEGVVTGAADGYGRMADRPAATLLHLGPGLGNGLANLHNARRARTTVVNIVGDHATYHKKYDAQLESDIEGVARNVSPGFVRWADNTAGLGQQAAETVAAAYGPPGQVATLVLPADVSWEDGGRVATPLPRVGAAAVPDERVEEVGAALRGGGSSALLLGNTAFRREPLESAARVAGAVGARLFGETFPPRIERGAGIPAVERIAYLAEMATAQLTGLAHLVLVDAKAPVSVFAYPGRPSYLVPDGCQVHTLAGPGEDAAAALVALADLLGGADGSAGQGSAGADLRAPAARPDSPTGPLSAAAVAAALGALLPEGAIVSDEGNTAGLWSAGATAGCPPHDWLCLTGGAIGQGLPLAVGAAVACPDRKVVALEADGSAMYTLQALWTMAREGLDVTVIVLANRSYAVLNMELDRVGAGAGGPRARDMLDLTRPELDFVALARGMGIPATSAESAEEFAAHLSAGLTEPGPNLIQALIPASL